MATAQAGPSLAAHGVDLVDEYDGGGLLLGLIEQVPDPAGAHAHIQLHKVRAGNGQEVDPRLAGHRLGDQRLAGARRAHQQHALGDPGAQGDELLGIPQKIHDLPQLLLLLLCTGHILEGDLLPLVGQGTGAGVSEAAGPRTSARAAPGLPQIHHVPESGHDQQQDQIGEHPVPPGPFDAHLVVVALQHAALVLLVDELVQVRIEHGQIGQLVVDRADLISFLPDLKAQVLSVQYEILDLLLLKQGPDLTVCGIVRLIHLLDRVDRKDHQQEQHEIEYHIPGTESLQERTLPFRRCRNTRRTRSANRGPPAPGWVSRRRPQASGSRCRADCGSARRSPGHNPPRTRPGW